MLVELDGVIYGEGDLGSENKYGNALDDDFAGSNI